MKKILIGCILAASTVSYSATDVMSTLEQLELNLQQLEAEEAEKTLAAQRKIYAEVSEKEKRIISVKDNKFYKGQYQELARKYGEAKKELGIDMEKQEEIIKMFPVIKEKKLAEFCDIFCEDEVFSVEESRKILNEAKKQGFMLKIHADEIVSLGGGELAGEVGAVSSEHLMAVSDEGIKSLKENGVIADILPATSFNLGKSYAPVRKMINEGVNVAVSTDYNPGSCPCENM